LPWDGTAKGARRPEGIASHFRSSALTATARKIGAEDSINRGNLRRVLNLPMMQSLMAGINPEASGSTGLPGFISFARSNGCEGSE
jgi:hypothetical protein